MLVDVDWSWLISKQPEEEVDAGEGGQDA